MTRYELLDRIGVGGMAEIFRGKAVAAGGFEKPVAIKRILPHLSQDKRFVELLIAEAKVLSLLKHRNIVQIFDVGLGDDGQYFLVMEYVDGKDVGAVQRGLEVRRHRMPFDLALHIGAEICEALEHAHTARAPDGKSMALVHRDVSPSNVLLSRAGEVKLTDFGIAKRAEQEATGHGSVRGKFAYISPEQARNEHIDPRSDVFSVGILLWELVTNRRLFSGLGDLEALRAVRDAKVPPAREVDPRLSPEVDQLLQLALAPDLKKRPTAGQLGSKLRALRYSLEVTVGDPSTELAKIIDTADEVERASQQMIAQQVGPSGGFRFGPSGSFASQGDHTEATVIRIRTADEFSMRDKDAGMARARQVIDQFEEEETRQAQLSGDQPRILRGNRRDSSDNSDVSELPPPSLPGVAPAPRKRRPTDEPTTTRPPVSDADIAAYAPMELPPNQRFDYDESTRLVARSRDRRTPAPVRQPRPATAPPPMPSTPSPGTVQRSSARPPTSSSGRIPPTNEPHSVSSPAAMPLGAPPPMPLPQPPPAPQPQPQMQPMPQPPQMQPPQPPPPMMYGGQPMPQPPHVHPPPIGPGNYPGWNGPPQRGALQTPPSGQDLFDPQRSYYPQRGSAPQMPGAHRSGVLPQRSKKPALRPWMLVLGALIMAALAFVVTRAFLS